MLQFFKKLGWLEYSVIAIVLLFGGIFVYGYGFRNSEESTSSANTKLRVYEFWGEGCPHCAKAEPFLKGLEDEYEGLELHTYEVYYNTGNQMRNQQVADALGVEAGGVPFIVVGDQVTNGFDSEQTTGKLIRERIEYCLANSCSDKAGEVLGFTPLQNLNEVSVKAVHHISVPEAQSLISEHAQDDSFTVLDIRTPAEVAEGTITDSVINIDFYADDFEQQLEGLDKNTTYLVYCRSGNRSAEAVKIMESLEFKTVYNLTGGILDWNQIAAQ